MSETAPRHPEIRTMVAFIEGRLAAEELKSVGEHLRGCRECRTVVAETSRFEEEERRASGKPAKIAWWLAAAAVIAAVVIAIPFVRHERTPIAQLIDVAPREHRLVEARLAGFPWARLQAPARGNPAPDPADLRLAGAAGEVLEETKGRGHPAGVAYLLIGRSQESIAALEQSANDAQSWNDLAAARYALATQEDRPSQLVEALAAADHALRIDPKLAEARFNRALILERMGVREKAREAWQQYLDIDPSSGWSNEARAHLRALGAQSKTFDPKMLDHPDAALVRAFPEQVRKYGEGPILCAWANGDATALSRARTIADALAAFNGEQLLDDAVAAIERGDGAQRAMLASAYRTYCDARLAYGKRKNAEAEQQLRRASELFARAGSPMTDVASYYAASAAFDQNRGAEAREQLLALRNRIDATRYRALSAQISWTLAVAANNAGDPATGAREADAAAAIFRSLCERSNESFVEHVAAISLQPIDDADAVWIRRIGALQSYCGGADELRCNGILNDAAAQLVSLDRGEEALALTNAAIDARDGDPFGRAMDSLLRARVALRVKGDAMARDALVAARAIVPLITDNALRESTEIQIAMEEAALRRAADAPRSIETLNRAVDFITSHDLGHLIPYAYLQRARAYRASGNDDGALADYRAALREIDRQDSRITETGQRLAFLDTARQVIDETVELELSRGAVADAFRVADARRQLHLAASTPRLPANVAAIEYAVLPHGLAIFCVTSEGIAAQRVGVERRELDARIDVFASAVRRRAPIGEVRAASSAAYALLIAPVRARLATIDQLVFVPDRQLFTVPFAALCDGRSGRFLIDDFEIRFAPAVSSLSNATATALTPALVIGDPPTSRPRLRAGRHEAAEVASLHQATLLAGEAATRASFVDAAQRSALIYFAGHAESDARASDAVLLLAGGASLGESDIARLRLERHPLVVLAACGTFRGDPMHVAGMSSLSRAFLLAGARAVVGTLWEVEDDVASTFFLRFHENLRAGASPSHALRDAQQAMLQSSDPRLMHPATWAPVELLSGNL